MRHLILFILFCTVHITTAQITTAEYFIDTDPGVGNAPAVTITNGMTISENFTINTIGLQDGIHALYIRTKDSDNNWSLYYNKTFRVRSSQTPIIPTQIVGAEYFIDTDPGAGNGSNISFSDGFSINENFNVPTTGLTDGIHTLYIRILDADNRWSLYYKQNFRVRTSTANITPTPIVSAEYFIDSDPGINNGTSISITAGFNLNETFTTSIDGLNTGTHTIHVRVKDADNRWSVYEVAEFEINTLSIDENELNAISVYPNPAQQFISIKDEGRHIKKFSIYTLNGQLISTKIFNNKLINISQLSSGVYLLNLYTKNSSTTKKIIKL